MLCRLYKLNNSCAGTNHQRTLKEVTWLIISYDAHLLSVWWFVGWRASSEVCTLCNYSQLLYRGNWISFEKRLKLLFRFTPPSPTASLYSTLPISFPQLPYPSKKRENKLYILILRKSIPLYQSGWAYQAWFWGTCQATLFFFFN